MKYYLQVTEELTEDECFIKQPQSFIKEIETNSQNEALSKAQKLYDNLYFLGLFNFVHKPKLQICRHDEGGACELIDLTKN